MNIRREISSIDEEICDFCGSPLFESGGFYTCFNCGLASNEPVTQSSMPFRENHFQNIRLENPENFKYLFKIEKWNSYETNSLNKVKRYISTILGQMDIINKKLERKVLNKYLKMKVPKGMNVSRMIPALISFFCKDLGIIINEDNLRDIAGIEPKKFTKEKNTLLMGKHVERENKEFKLKKQRGYVFQILINDP